MKKILFLVLLGLCSCAARVDLDSLEEDIADIRKIQAGQTSEISDLKDQVRQLSGKLEEANYTAETKMGSEVETLTQTVEQLKRKLPPPSSIPSSLLEKDESLTSNLDPNLSRDLMNAFSMLRSGDYKLAQTYLEEASGRDVDGKVTPIILYWKGITLTGLGDDKAALARYTEVVSAFPKHPRAADSLYQQMRIFQKSGQADLAKITYQKLQSDFPGSEAAIQAKSRM